jgi:hypothetical protein
MKAQIKSALIFSLEQELDQYMADRGFKRFKASLSYLRNVANTVQRLDIPIQIHPSDNPNSAAAIYPWMEVRIPPVDRILDEMIGADFGLLEGVSGGTSKQPISFISQKQHTGRWYVYQPDSISEIVVEMRTVFETWAMPLLETYRNAEDIVAADERGDQRLIRDRAQIMRVVAAAIACGRRDYARKVMEKAFSAPGARTRYAKVFEFIEQSD